MRSDLALWLVWRGYDQPLRMVDDFISPGLEELQRQLTIERRARLMARLTVAAWNGRNHE
jgi:hypothetical protein